MALTGNYYEQLANETENYYTTNIATSLENYKGFQIWKCCTSTAIFVYKTEVNGGSNTANDTLNASLELERFSGLWEMWADGRSCAPRKRWTPSHRLQSSPLHSTVIFGCWFSVALLVALLDCKDMCCVGSLTLSLWYQDAVTISSWPRTFLLSLFLFFSGSWPSCRLYV